MSTGLDAQQQIFTTNPDDRRSFEALEEHFFLEGDWEALAGIYRERIAAPSIEADPEKQAALLFRLGQILEERILDSQAASKVYWRLARLDPTNRPALRQLRGIHEQRQQWDLVLQIAELEGQTSMPPYERAAFEAELGRCWHRQLDDPEEAQRAYTRALEADASFPPALEGLAGLHRDAGRFDEAAEILEKLCQQLRGPERAPAWTELGTLYAGSLDNPERARSCFEHALEDDPFQTPAVEWALLLATASEDWAAVAELLERRFDLAAGARHRAAIAVEASQLQLDRIGSAAAARAWVDRALELAQDETTVLLALADVERVDGEPQALLGTLEKLIGIAGKHAPRTALFEAAQLHARFGHSEAALEAIRRAADKYERRDVDVLLLEAQLLRESGANRELGEVLEILTGLEVDSEDALRTAHLRELAQLQEEDLDDEEGALTSWQRAFALEPSDQQTRDALDRLYRKRDDWESLASMLESALGAASDDEQATLGAQLGALRLEHFDDAAGARARFEAALAIDSKCTRALAGLRTIAQQSDDPDLLLEICERQAADCEDAEQIAELAQICIPLLEARESIEDAYAWTLRWSEKDPRSRDALQKRADLESRLQRPEAEIETHRALVRLLSGREQNEHLRRQAELYLATGDAAAAVEALELTLESEPENLDTLSTLAEAYRATDRLEDLARTLRPLADALPPQEQAPLLDELARILHDPIGDLDTAIVVRWRLVDLPNPPEGAQIELESLLELAGRNTELAQLLDGQRAMLGDETSEAFELDLRRARLRMDALGQSEEAAEILSALHDRHPDDDTILDDLERALREGDDAQRLCELLERRAGWTEDADRRVAMDLERASLLEVSLGNALAACDLYEEISREHAGSESAERASARLETLLEANGEWRRLRTLLTDRLADLPDEEQASLRERIANLSRDRLGDVSGCAEQLEAIAQIAPERIDVWQRLESIYSHDLDRPADWLRVVDTELAGEPSRERALSLCVNAARLFLDDDRRPPGRDAADAHAYYERVLELDPNHAEAVEVLAHHYTAVGRPEDALAILETRLDRLAATDSNETLDLRLRVADLHAALPSGDAKARLHYETAREELGATPRISTPLFDIYERAEDHDAIVGLCQDVLATDSQDALSILWRTRLAAAERARGELDAAAIAYRGVLADSPDDRVIEDALIEIYEQTGEIDPLTEILEKRLPYCNEDEEIALRLRLAGLHEDDRGDKTAALGQLEQILERHPYHRDVFETALRLATDLRDTSRTMALLDRTLGTRMGSARRADLLEQRGHLFTGELADPERAVPCFREAVSLDPTRESARLALREQLTTLERWPAVIDCLFVESTRAEGAERIEILELAADTAWERISPDAALPWLARLREVRPESTEIPARLAEVHRRAGRFESALGSLEEELALHTDPAKQCRIQIERAQILEREIHAPARAIGAYECALELSDAPAEILEELDRLYAQTDRNHERAAILERRAELATGSDAIEIRQGLASLYAVDLAQPEKAIAPLLRNVDASRDDDAEQMIHLGSLDTALRTTGQSEAWIRVAERELELIERHREIRESTPADYTRFLREELARIYDVDLGQSDRAIEHLLVLADTEGDSSRTDERLRELLRRTGRRPELERRLSAHLEAESELGTADEWLELALLREEALHDLRGAVRAYQEARSLDEHRPEVLRGLRRCHERLGDWKGFADALEAELDPASALSRSQRAATARRLGEISWRRLASPERAASAYERALEFQPDDQEALHELIEVREAQQDSEAAIALYHRELDRIGSTSEDREREREVWLRIASHERLRDAHSPAALDAFKAAARIEPLSPADELSMARLHETLGEDEAFAEVFARWCDRADSGASIEDHLELARHLAGRGDVRVARDRTTDTTVTWPTHAEGWALLGELEREMDNTEAASKAFERAADHAEACDAARHCLAAAECLPESSADRAHALLVRAHGYDSSSLSAMIALARSAAALGYNEEALSASDSLLEIAADQEIDEALRLEMALLGARAARNLRRLDASRRLCAQVLEIEPGQTEALEGLAEADFEDGEYRSARAILEQRIEEPGENPDLGLHLARIARGLEAEDLLDAAWSRYEEAIELRPDLDDAHEGLIRVHERATRTEEALRCLERWAEKGSDEVTRAGAALRAGEHALALDDRSRAKRNLEDATRLDRTLSSAWLLLCEIACDSGPSAEARSLCEKALDAIEPGELSATISLRAASLAERAGDTPAARSRYAEAARWNPRCTEAILCESRLARGDGDWVEADGVLARFLDTHPDPDSPTLAHIHLERGRLLSGPLEDFAEAARAYERALELQPDLGVARSALGGLLMHSPERWRDALALHQTLLDASPTTASSLRALAQLARQRGQNEVAEGALAVLCALGLASPQEASGASSTLRFPIQSGPPMSDPESERLRRLAHLLREEIGEVLSDVDRPLPQTDDSTVAGAVREIVSMEAELAAPQLSRLDPEERRTFFATLTALFLDPGGNGGSSRYRDALENALGRWVRRKARRIVEETDLERVEAVDPTKWGAELRAIAAGRAVDQLGGDLRVVVRALLLIDPETPEHTVSQGAEIAALASTSDTTRRLLSRITNLLCERLERSR